MFYFMFKFELNFNDRTFCFFLRSQPGSPRRNFIRQTKLRNIRSNQGAISLDMSSNQTLKSSPYFAFFAKASVTLLQE